MTILSKEMEKEIISILDKRLLQLVILKNIENIEKDVKVLKREKQDATEMISELEDRIDEMDMNTPTSQQISDRFIPVEENIENLQKLIIQANFIKEGDLERLVGKTMLKLMPSFNEKISKEVKNHFVALAEYVIKHFKEKE